MAERHLSLVPETPEVVACEYVEERGGEYEWACIRAPHGDDQHYLLPFKVA